MSYIPPSYFNAKKKDFLNLRKRGMSIAEYEQKFLRLSCYAGGIIKAEKNKCMKFKNHLYDCFRKNVATMQHKNFYKLLSFAFTWKRLNTEKANRNENRLQKPRLNFGGP